MEELKTLRINLKGIVNAKIDELNEFQEEIKVLTEENYQKLKNEILEDGFSFSPHVFIDQEGKIWILDGHQRKTCLSRMQDEGYEIPTIPCMEVEAENLEHARRLVLAGTSQYGTFQPKKLVEFTKKIGIEPIKAVDRFVLPTVKFENLISISPHIRDISGAKEIDPETFNELAHKCPKCGFEFND